MRKVVKWVRVLFWPLYAVSLLLPILSAFQVIGPENEVAGYLDVAIAFLLFFCLVVMERHFPEKEAGVNKLYRHLSVLFLLGIGLYFLVGNRLDWEVLIIGLGWRVWLLIHALPFSFRKQ